MKKINKIKLCLIVKEESETLVLVENQMNGKFLISEKDQAGCYVWHNENFMLG